MQKILPCVSLLVSCKMKNPNEAGKFNEFGKIATYSKLYKRKYIKLSYSKFDYFKKITTKIFLSKRNSFELRFDIL